MVPGLPGPGITGTAFAITVDDHGEDGLLGLDLEFFGSTLTACGSAEPFVTVERGNFTVG